ncbi:hypothetical protein [Rhodococcus sp. NPDC127528]|uniref:hypothetical protein n=1 Tax=unclassified Rhodococcus (in: high G+C Gram-positive bacteria) TaxID=192944 RepID=UPI0036340A08
MGAERSWTSLASGWLDPVATLGAGTTTALLPDTLVTAVSTGIARRYVGRRITVSPQGVPVTALLGSLRIRRRGAHLQSRVRLTDVVWTGPPVSELIAVANGVRLVPGAPSRVHTAQIEVRGRIAVPDLLDWINGRGHDWIVRDGESGLFHAEHRDRRLRAVVDAALIDDAIRIGVVEARWRGVPVPRRYLRGRTVPLPALPHGIRGVNATRDEDVVSFTLEVPSLTTSFDLTQLIRAVTG